MLDIDYTRAPTVSTWQRADVAFSYVRRPTLPVGNLAARIFYSPERGAEPLRSWSSEAVPFTMRMGDISAIFLAVQKSTGSGLHLLHPPPRTSAPRSTPFGRIVENEVVPTVGEKCWGLRVLEIADGRRVGGRAKSVGVPAA